MNSKFIVLDSISKSGGKSNDDLIGITESCVWLLDGATGLTDNNILPGTSDAKWFVQAVSRNMVDNLQKDLSLNIILENVINAVIKEFEGEVNNESIEDIQKPSASFTIARIAGECVELGNIGDCRAIYKNCEKEVGSFGTSRVTELDQFVVNRMVELKQKGSINDDEIWLKLKDILYRNRNLKNTDEGYWILDLTLRPIPYLQKISIFTEDIEEILLVSDGLYRLVDTYHLYSDETFLNAALSLGLDGLYDKLRDIENMDSDCQLYPRIKPQDDASGLLVSLG